MADASYTQTSFLGGEISQWAQGQFDKPYYKIALDKALNIWPTDEGSAPRRPGFRFLGTTNNGNPGRLLAFDFTQATPYNLEVSDNLIRMWNNINLVTTNDNQQVQSISSDVAAVFTLNQTVTWQTGDTVYFTFLSPQSAFVGNVLLNKQFKITMLNASQFTAADSITGHVIGATDGVVGLLPVVNHVLGLTTTYSIAQNDWHSLRLVQGYNVAALLHTSVAPQALTVLQPPITSTFATFSLTTAPFQDGPYLDPPPVAIATPNSTAAVVQLTVGYPAWTSNTIYGFGTAVTFGGQDYLSIVNNNINITPGTNPAAWQALSLGAMVNDGKGFVATDVGRMVRLFSQPQIWLPGTTYGAGDAVTYNGAYFSSLVGSNMNNEPDISTTQWVINPSAAIWTWGVIIIVNSQNNVTVQLQGAPLLYQSPIFTWQLGAWSNTTGWPTCGWYHEGRFWYAGAIPNRFDTSQPGAPFNMAPTAQDGTVTDSNGISYTLNASQQNPIFDGIPDHAGVLIFTQEGEWLVSSGTTGSPITPSNIQAHRETKYGSSNILAVRTGLTICFVKRYARRIMEYLADVLSGRFFGNDLTKNARHLGSRGIEEIDYQEELVPTVWARCTDGTLIGSTYRRNSLFSNQEAEFNAFHQHVLGSGRLIESISVGPSVNGTLDALSLVTNDPSTDIRYVEQMTTLLDETASVAESWYLDTAVTPQAAAANLNSFFSTSNWGAGAIDLGLEITDPSGQAGGVRPIVAAGSPLAPTAVWVGGLTVSGTTASFQVKRLDVTGDTPAILATYTSGSFTLNNSQVDVSWAVDPTGRYIAMYTLNDIDSKPSYVIFDTTGLSFGTVLQPGVALAGGGTKQLGWVDNSHIVLDNVSGLVRGVEVLSVSGTTLSDLGFTGVWGASSGSGINNLASRTPLSYSQYSPIAGGGLINYMTDNISGTYFSKLFGVSLKWVSGSLSVGTPYTIASGISTGTASGPHSNLLQISPSEWFLCFGTVSDFNLISFQPGLNSATVTRPWQHFVSAVGTGITQCPVYFSENNAIIILQRTVSDNFYHTTTIYLEPGSFLQTATATIGNRTATTSYSTALRLDAERLLFVGTGGASFDQSECGIITDPPGIPNVVNFYCLEPFNGKTVSVFAAGIDCGDYVVVNGQVQVPIGTVDPETGWVFNEQSFQTLQPLTATFEDISVPVLYAGKVYNIPCVIGFNYESQGQLCRPQMPVDTGARNGPGFGKKRRAARYAIQLVNSIGVYAGTDLAKTKQVPLTKVDAGGKKLNYLQTFSGILRETLADDFSYDSKIAWKIKRPYPATVVAYGAFISTEDV